MVLWRPTANNQRYKTTACFKRIFVYTYLSCFSLFAFWPEMLREGNACYKLYVSIIHVFTDTPLLLSWTLVMMTRMMITWLCQMHLVSFTIIKTFNSNCSQLKKIQNNFKMSFLHYLVCLERKGLIWLRLKALAKVKSLYLSIYVFSKLSVTCVSVRLFPCLLQMAWRWEMLRTFQKYSLMENPKERTNQ